MQNMILQILLPGTGRRYRKPITRRYSFRTRGACAVDHEGAIRSLSGHSRHLLDPSLPVMVVDLRTQHKPSHLRQFAKLLRPVSMFSLFPFVYSWKTASLRKSSSLPADLQKERLSNERSHIHGKSQFARP